MILIFLVSAGCGPDQAVPRDAAALVDGRPITFDELRRAARAGLDFEPQLKPEVKKIFLNRLIDEKLIIMEAERQGLVVSQKELEAELEKIKKDFSGRAFQEMMVREYIDPESWKQRVALNLLLEKATKAALAERVKSNPDEWRLFLEKFPRPNPRPARVKLKHITTPTREQAEKARKMLSEGRPFAEVARDLLESEDLAEVNQELWVTPEYLPEPLRRVIQEVEPGAPTQVAQSDYGFSVFLILDVEEARPADPIEIISRARRSYFEQLRTRAYQAWIKELRSRAEIVLNPALEAEFNGTT